MTPTHRVRSWLLLHPKPSHRINVTLRIKAISVATAEVGSPLHHNRSLLTLP